VRRIDIAVDDDRNPHGLLDRGTGRVLRAAAVVLIARASMHCERPDPAALGDAVMIGRAAQGRPWLFREIAHYLDTGALLAPPTLFEIRRWLLEHLDQLYAFYGEARGVRVARKHIQWYCQDHPDSDTFWQAVNRVADAAAQRAAVAAFLDRPQDERAA
jgi:tRNA-dihydrouridine synthase